jgi:hypothetical protein
MFTRSFSVGRTRVPGRSVSLVLALGLVAVALLLAGCPMEDDDTTGVPGLDDNLKGTWEFSGPYGYERYVITNTELHYYSAPPGDATEFVENWSGKMVFAEGFTGESGIIIIEYIHKQEWSAWKEDSSGTWVSTPLDPQPPGNFYGIYYNNLAGGAVGDTVFLSNTSDQANNFGPTEAETLDSAKAKFTLGNMNKYIDVEMTSPVTKK